MRHFRSCNIRTVPTPRNSLIATLGWPALEKSKTSMMSSRDVWIFLVPGNKRTRSKSRFTTVWQLLRFVNRLAVWVGHRCLPCISSRVFLIVRLRWQFFTVRVIDRLVFRIAPFVIILFGHGQFLHSTVRTDLRDRKFRDSQTAVVRAYGPSAAQPPAIRQDDA